MIAFYCGINETSWNKTPTAPGAAACISPVYGATEKTKRENRVKIPEDTIVIQDSGAFSDGPKSRLSLAESLDRQLNHSLKFSYDTQITHRASYDVLIDEVWTDGNRHKRRWDEIEAWGAVEETIKAAEFLASNYNGGRILSAKGVTALQYLECAKGVMPFFNPKEDIFGLGGWCICGKYPSFMRAPFDKTMSLVLPYLEQFGVKKIHIWGVIDPLFLGPLLYMADNSNLKLSTDSCGPSLRPSMGVWGYRGWKDKNYKRETGMARGKARAKHVEATRNWLLNLRTTEFYKAPSETLSQLSLIS